MLSAVISTCDINKPMKSNRKQIIIVTAIAIALFVVIGFLTARRQMETPPALPYPVLPNIIEGELSTKHSLQEKDFNFPSKIPSIQYTLANITESKAKKIASDLNYDFEPTTFQGEREGLSYIWSGKYYTLIITPQTSTIKYTYNYPPIEIPLGKVESVESLADISKEFLVGKSLLSEDEIKVFSIVAYAPNPLSQGYKEVDDLDKALFYRVSFTYEVSNYEILTLSPSNPLIMVDILPDGIIFNVEVVKLENIELTNSSYILKTYEDIENSLDQAILVSLINDYISISDLTSADIKLLDIDKIELAYLLDNPLTKILQPIFLLEGDVEVVNSSADRAQLYLPAIKTP